jgi:uncharacterized protein
LVHLLIALLFAALFWMLIFALKVLNFWWGMAFAAGTLAIWSIIWAGKDRKRFFEFRLSHFIWGVISAIILYVIFWIGGLLSARIFPFASNQINSIYANNTQLRPWVIALLLLFCIGPAEEIFWRGMAQRTLSKYFGANAGWIIGAFIYAVVHFWSKNLILVIAAMVGGLYWGWLYKRFGSLWPGIVSHALWDITIFLIFPLQQI